MIRWIRKNWNAFRGWIGHDDRPMSHEEIVAYIHEAYQELERRGPPVYPDPMESPWQFYPHIPFGSIGWRMGSGEDYWHDFRGWFRELSESEQKSYMCSQPEPENWTGFYEIVLSR